ncbi:Uncharacterised protein [Rodentibacter pneumotropicus]|uniref:Uncharacterized protein n=1 Tax=Rodentibacter pneumotropicus TaxID=758 RepID=A0A3S4Y0A5_9PAST|nr:Uncharacterised protein [Rodentibacter pneumotropicus]
MLGLLCYAIFSWSNAESWGMFGHILGAVLFLTSFGLMWHYSKDPNALQVWLDSLPDDGRDVFLNLPMSCRGIFFNVPQFSGESENFTKKMTALYAEQPEQHSATKPDIVVALLESTLNPHQFAFTQQISHHCRCLNGKMIRFLCRRYGYIPLPARLGDPNLAFLPVCPAQILVR